MENNLLNEEINRVKELMKIPINEANPNQIKGLWNLVDNAKLAADDVVKQSADRLANILKKNPDDINSALNAAKKIQKDAKKAAKSAKTNLDNLKATNRPKSEIDKATLELKNKIQDSKDLKNLTKGIDKTKLDGNVANLKKASEKIDDTISQSRSASTSAGNLPVVPPPPTNNPQQIQKWWQNPKFTKSAKIAAAVAAGGALLTGLYFLLRKNGDTETSCLLQNLFRHPGNIKEKSRTSKGTYYSVTPTNPEINRTYPKITIEAESKNKRVFYNGKFIGNWTHDSGCILYMILGNKKIPIFLDKSNTPTPGPKKRKFRPCTGTYNFGCQSRKIGELQSCLGITVDNKWGKNTEAAVFAKFAKRVLTDAEIDQKCKAQPAPPTPAPKVEPEGPQEFEY